MTNPLKPTADLIVNSFGLFATEIKRISKEAKHSETTDLALNAEKLEGLTLDQIVELIAGTAGLTVAQVKAELDDFISTMVDVPTVKATDVTVMETTNDAAIVTPKALWDGIGAWWATVVGTSPETLNEIHEIAAALQNNPDIISVIQDQVATKASIVDVDAHVERLEGLIEDANTVFATQEETDTGTEGAKSVAPDTLKVTLDAAIAASTTAIMADVNASLVDINNAIQAAILDLQTPDETEGPTTP